MGSWAPGDLKKVQLFLHTWDEEDQREDLDSPASLDRFFKDNDLWPGGRASGDAELAEALEVRDAINALLRHNHGDPLDPSAPKKLNDVAESAGFSIVFGGDNAAVSARANGALGALGNLLAIIAGSMSEGTWSRMKICQNDACAVPFYDKARNRSGKWCSMEVCGNRVKARNFRARHA
jgi:predicted RNA-binding Zn ribbon-like protein